MKTKLHIIGGVGAGITALCCFTPLLVVIMTGIGAAGAIAYLDYVLMPLLAFFLVLTGVGFIYAKKQKAEDCCDVPTTQETK